MATVWHQSDLIDENEPVGFATIEEHLARDDVGNLMLADFYGEHTRPAVDGQIIHFERHENIGTGMVSVNDDWSWSASPTAPEAFDSLSDDDGWTAGSVEEHIKSWRSSGLSPACVDGMKITFWRSTTEKRRVCFKAGALVPVEGKA